MKYVLKSSGSESCLANLILGLLCLVQVSYCRTANEMDVWFEEAEDCQCLLLYVHSEIITHECDK
jgi:hypothetical protein